ncbi:MAG: hypothetical protein GVY27_06805 [Deinococcus-Thermus bacterium]|jgi:hypothetical protein|nr:hypothetical protein [Deinococcota bacterium]
MGALGAVVAALFAGLAVFQSALALGAPCGRLAWGGAHSGRLPPRLRLASAAALLPAVAGGIVALRAGNLVGWPSAAAATVTLYALAALFALSAAGNAVSRSRAERRLGLPLATALAAGCLALASGARP